MGERIRSRGHRLVAGTLKRMCARPAVWLAVLAGAAVIAVACGGGGGDEGRGPNDPAFTGTTPSARTVSAPDFPGGHTWFNVSEPPSLADLQGKLVLLDFWTSGCINCQQIIPDLTRLEEEFADELVVIGVHSGKYDREQEDESVRQSILRYGLRHAVVNDPDFIIWSMYGVNAWPTLVLIDPAGNVVGARPGEGVYPAFQPVIAALVAEFDALGEIDRSPFAIDLEADAVTSTFLSYPSAVLADEAGSRLFIAGRRAQPCADRRSGRRASGRDRCGPAGVRGRPLRRGHALRATRAGAFAGRQHAVHRGHAQPCHPSGGPDNQGGHDHRWHRLEGSDVARGGRTGRGDGTSHRPGG